MCVCVTIGVYLFIRGGDIISGTKLGFMINPRLIFSKFEYMFEVGDPIVSR